MNSVPFLYINISALCCYGIILAAFLAAKKTPETRSFILLIFDALLWTGGSVLMRLQIYPGIRFWYTVSILALFSFAFLAYLFVCSFARVRGFLLKVLWGIGTLGILVLEAFGVFLAAPSPEKLPDGGVVFTYTMEWKIVIPLAFFMCIVVSIFFVVRNLIREKGIRTPGLQAIIFGCLIIALGNMVEIIPGNTFPWDTLTGVAFAVSLMYALYKKRMFRLTLLVSKNVVLLTSCLLCILGSAYFVPAIKNALVSGFGISDNSATCIVVVLFSILLVVVYFLLKKLMDALFTREEQQNRILKDFSNRVSRTLNTDEVMSELIGVITDEIPVCGVFVCLPEDGAYVARYSSNPLDAQKFSISADSPLVTYLKSEDMCFTVEEFRSSPYYLSMWQGEKKIFKEMDVACVVGLGDGEDIVGLLLLSGKERGASYTYGELSFLGTVSTITSIAVKNACLYERVYYESRTDTLTGVYNYKYFMERIDADFNACRDDSLALVYLDIDDFKLYNQLYGNDEGDTVLCSVAQIITLVTGKNGTVFRVSGKVFAVLLPRYDGRRALLLAEEIRRRVGQLNSEPNRHCYKQLTISGGICVYPFAAASAKELMENADMAVYNAKNAGKNTTVIFKGALPVSHQIVERAMDILERAENDANSSYKASSATIHALTAAIDAKDNYTGNHSRNVARYSTILATAAGLNDEQVQIIYEAALMHDIGKISIPERILNKTDKLTGDEFDQMKEHVNNAIEMIRHLPSMDYVIPAAIGHHERWDGKGYPRGIAGEDIPISARCLAVADAFDAMTTDRPYRKGLPVEYAADQIEKNAGTQFDPNLAHVFAELVRSGEIVVCKCRYKEPLAV